VSGDETSKFFALDAFADDRNCWLFRSHGSVTCTSPAGYRATMDPSRNVDNLSVGLVAGARYEAVQVTLEPTYRFVVTKCYVRMAG
jgi:hypothetical protein